MSPCLHVSMSPCLHVSMSPFLSLLLSLSQSLLNPTIPYIVLYNKLALSNTLKYSLFSFFPFSTLLPTNGSESVASNFHIPITITIHLLLIFAIYSSTYCFLSRSLIDFFYFSLHNSFSCFFLNSFNFFIFQSIFRIISSCLFFRLDF